MKNNLRRLFYAALLIGACVPEAAAKDREKSCIVNFEVVRDYNGKPVRNAAVVIHPVDKGGKQRRNGAELKTDSDGNATYPGLPYGKVRIQVIAPGLQTYGEDFEIKDETKTIEIKMKRPQEQYSIYKSNKDDKKKDPEKDHNDPKK